MCRIRRVYTHVNISILRDAIILDIKYRVKKSLSSARLHNGSLAASIAFCGCKVFVKSQPYEDHKRPNLRPCFHERDAFRLDWSI